MLTKKNLGVEIEVSNALDTLTEEFTLDSNVNNGITNQKMIYGLDGLGMSTHATHDVLREERQCSVMRGLVRRIPESEV